MGLWSAIACGSGGASSRGSVVTTLDAPAVVFFGDDGWMVVEPSAGAVSPWKTTSAASPGEIQRGRAFTILTRRFGLDGVLYTAPFPSGASSAVLSPDGTQLAWTARDGVHLRALPQGQERAVGSGTAPAFSHDDGAFAMGVDDTVVVWDAIDAEASRTIWSPDGRPVSGVAWSGTGQLAFVTGANEGGAWRGRLYTVEPGAMQAQPQSVPSGSWPTSPVWAPGGGLLAVLLAPEADARSSRATGVAVVEPASGALTMVVPVEARPVTPGPTAAYRGVGKPVAWSPDATQLAFTGAFEGDCRGTSAGLRCTFDVFTVRADGSEQPTRLTHLEMSSARDVAWPR